MGMERMQMKQVNSDNLFFVNSYVSLNFESILCPLIVHSMILSMNPIKRKWAKTWMGSSCLYHEKYIDTCKIGKQNIHRIKLERKTEKIHF